MGKMIAFCGVDCLECDAYKATKNDDNTLREKTAKEWSEYIKININPEDINCLGCDETSEIKYMHCPECKIRSCALEKGMLTCADCDSYICGLLQEFYDLGAVNAKENLDALRSNRCKK